MTRKHAIYQVATLTARYSGKTARVRLPRGAMTCLLSREQERRAAVRARLMPGDYFDKATLADGSCVEVEVGY